MYVIEGIRDRALNASEKTVKLYIRDYFFDSESVCLSCHSFELLQ